MQQRVKYDVSSRPPLLVTALGALQWVGFVVAANAMVPLVLGDAFGLSRAAVAALAQRAFFIIGVVSLAQLLWGHRWPISEGVSYVSLGVFVALAGVARAAGHNPQVLLPKLEGGLILAGLLLVVAALSGLANAIQRLFTPTIVATYLILLPIQFSGPFLRAMFGVGVTGARLDVRVLLVSLAAVVTALGCSFLGRGAVRSLSSLLGLVVGIAAWVIARLPVQTGLSTVRAQGSFFLAWGVPQWDFGVSAMIVITGFLLLSNVVASLVATGEVIGEPLSEITFRRATAVNGAGSVVAGLFSGVGLVPVATSAGFVGFTGLASRLPFLFSTLVLIGASFWPQVARWVTVLPLPLAYAVTFAAFSEMFGLGVLRLRQVSLTRGNLATLSLSVFIGTGLMFLPPGALAGVSTGVRNLLGNGLLTGVLLALILEHLAFKGLVAPV